MGGQQETPASRLSLAPVLQSTLSLWPRPLLLRLWRPGEDCGCVGSQHLPLHQWRPGRPGVRHTCRGRKGRLLRRFYYLQYLKLLYNKLKAEYAREYYRTKHQSNYGKLFPLKGVRLHSVATDLQYDDDYYYDYDYDDYSGATSG